MENKRYTDLKVTEGTYVPPVTMNYPEDDPYVGLYQPVYDREYLPIDATYPYYDPSWRNKLRVAFGYAFVLRPLGWILRIRYGLRWRIEGETKWRRSSCGVRRWLKQFDLSRGAITIANHCYRHDCASVLTTFHASARTRIPMFAPNFRTKDQFYLRIVGGIPIPAAEAGLSAMKAFNAAFDAYDKEGSGFISSPRLSTGIGINRFVRSRKVRLRWHISTTNLSFRSQLPIASGQVYGVCLDQRMNP